MIRFASLILLICFQFAGAYSWHNYLNRTERVFNYQDVEGFGPVLCTSKGLVDAGNQLHSYGNLPVLDAVSYSQDTLLLIQGDFSYSDGLYKLSKYGSFEAVMLGMGFNFVTKDPQSNSYYLGTYSGLLKSDNGRNWQPVDYFYGKNCRKMVFKANKAAVLLQQEYPSNVFWSNDGGSSWASADTTVFFFQDIDFTDEGDLVGMFADGSYSDGMYRYNPATHLWDLLFFGCFQGNAMLPDGDKFWVGYMYGRGLDRYLPQQYFGTGMPNPFIHKIKRFSIINTPSIICCTDSGAYFLTNYTAISPEQPKQTSLLSAYPNPFNSTTNIIYSLNSEAVVDIRVYNAAGKEVFHHAAGQQTAGSHTLQLKTDGWSSGVYLCQLISENQSTKSIKLLYCR